MSPNAPEWLSLPASRGSLLRLEEEIGSDPPPLEGGVGKGHHWHRVSPLFPGDPCHIPVHPGWGCLLPPGVQEPSAPEASLSEHSSHLEGQECPLAPGCCWVSICLWVPPLPWAGRMPACPGGCGGLNVPTRMSPHPPRAEGRAQQPLPPPRGPNYPGE